MKNQMDKKTCAQHFNAYNRIESPTPALTWKGGVLMQRWSVTETRDIFLDDAKRTYSHTEQFCSEEWRAIDFLPDTEAAYNPNQLPTKGGYFWWRASAADEWQPLKVDPPVNGWAPSINRGSHTVEVQNVSGEWGSEVTQPVVGVASPTTTPTPNAPVAPEEVIAALFHVRTYYPGVDRVAFWDDGRWAYMTDEHRVPVFDTSLISTYVLDAAGEAVSSAYPGIPVAFQLSQLRICDP